MKIITWNCNGAFRKKFIHLENFEADIFIIQECENPSEVNHKEYKDWSGNYLWIGDNKNKGLGIFAKNGIELKRLDWSDNFKDHKVKYFLPCEVNNKFNLLGVWTHLNNSPTFGYIGQLWKYLQINQDKLKNSLVIGDFNSNQIWDKWDRWWNHSDVVNELQKIKVESLYHKFYDEEQGKESKPTFFLQRKIEKPYHIDYVFGSENFSDKLENISIGNVEKWLELSDHLPIICDFQD